MSGVIAARPVRPNPRPHTAGEVLHLQRTAGNGSTAALLAVQRDSNAPVQMPGANHPALSKAGVVRSGTKVLRGGTMEWSLEITSEGIDESKDANKPSAIIQIVFTPAKKNALVSFLQTKARSAVGKQAASVSVDMLADDYDPFYGAQWDPSALDWKPEAAPEGQRNAPSGPTEPKAYLYDEPWAPPDSVIMLESVAVDMRSGVTLGSLRWGVGGGRLVAGNDADCTDQPSAQFGPAVESYYATPTQGTPTGAGPRFEAILDEFRGSDATLSDEHRSDLDRVATTFLERRKNSKPRLLVAGFGDAMDRDPKDASKRRTDAAVAYLVAAGVPRERIKPTSFGDTWARAAVSMKEGRNRRVQVTMRYD
jgi:outer membrane protein OmpA-like peptidoglycan-associated protein